MKTLQTVLCHIMLVLSIALGTFYFLDIANPLMKFLTCEFSLFLVLVLAVVSLLCAIITIIRNHKEDR